MTQSRARLSNPGAVHPPVGKYSHLARVEASELLFLAGQVAVDVDGGLVGEGDAAAQTRQVFENIGKVLRSAGATFGDVVALTTYVVGRESVEPYTSARAEVFDEMFPGEQYPPNTLLVISGLAREEYLVEVTAVAALP